MGAPGEDGEKHRPPDHEIHSYRGDPPHRSGLLQLYQRAQKVLGMEEKDRLVMGANPRLSVTQNTGAFSLQLIAGSENIRHFVADMMDATRRIARQELADRAAVAERIKQLDLGIGQFHEYDGDTMRRLIERSRYLGAERVAVKCRRLFKIGHDDCHVIELTDHGSPLDLLLPVNIAGQGTPIAEQDELR